MNAHSIQTCDFLLQLHKPIKSNLHAYKMLINNIKLVASDID